MERQAAKELLKKIEHDVSFPKQGQTTSGVILSSHSALKEALNASIEREEKLEKSLAKAEQPSKKAAKV